MGFYFLFYFILFYFIFNKFIIIIIIIFIQVKWMVLFPRTSKLNSLMSAYVFYWYYMLLKWVYSLSSAIFDFKRNYMRLIQLLRDIWLCCFEIIFGFQNFGLCCFKRSYMLLIHSHMLYLISTRLCILVRLLSCHTQPILYHHKFWLWKKLWRC